MNLRFIIAVSILLFWVTVWTISFHFIESWTRINSFYFSVSTLTTVGYWDITPVTETGRLFTAIYILLWVTTVVWWSVSIIWNRTITHSEENIYKWWSFIKEKILKNIEIFKSKD